MLADPAPFHQILPCALRPTLHAAESIAGQCTDATNADSTTTPATCWRLTHVYPGCSLQPCASIRHCRREARDRDDHRESAMCGDVVGIATESPLAAVYSRNERTAGSPPVEPIHREEHHHTDDHDDQANEDLKVPAHTMTVTGALVRAASGSRSTPGAVGQHEVRRRCTDRRRALCAAVTKQGAPVIAARPADKARHERAREPPLHDAPRGRRPSRFVAEHTANSYPTANVPMRAATRESTCAPATGRPRPRTDHARRYTPPSPPSVRHFGGQIKPSAGAARRVASGR